MWISIFELSYNDVIVEDWWGLYQLSFCWSTYAIQLREQRELLRHLMRREKMQLYVNCAFIQPKIGSSIQVTCCKEINIKMRAPICSKNSKQNQCAIPCVVHLHSKTLDAFDIKMKEFHVWEGMIFWECHSLTLLSLLSLISLIFPSRVYSDSNIPLWLKFCFSFYRLWQIADDPPFTSLSVSA